MMYSVVVIVVFYVIYQLYSVVIYTNLIVSVTLLCLTFFLERLLVFLLQADKTLFTLTLQQLS